MKHQQYQDINRALCGVAMALSALHDPLYVCGMHKDKSYLKMANGMEELRIKLAALKGVVGAVPAKEHN